jgi:prefoldin subunit 5
MQYVSLSKVPNRYPTISNYTKFKDDLVLLNGLYPERNKINFQLPKYEDITPVDNTTFRFVISVLADDNDSNPKYFTSKPFYNDIKLAYRVGNPFFPIQALIGGGSVLTINLKQYFEIFDKFETDEKDAPVDVIKNIFITDTASTSVDIDSNKQELATINEQIDKLNEEIAALETELEDQSTKPSKGVGRIGERTRLRKRKGTLTDTIEKLNVELSALTIKKNKLEESITELSNSVKNSLLSDNSIIDYQALIRFIDFMVQPPKFELSGIETNNTIPAEQIGEWSGEFISAYKRRQAGEVIEATTIDERITPPAQEGEKTFIQKVAELPVIKQIVGAVKAVGKFFKKLFSDSRLKTDIVKVGQVEDINIYKFKFKFDKSKTQIGVIAQELLNTKYADCISTDPSTGFYIVNYNILQQKVDIVGGIDRIQKELAGGKGLFAKLRNRIESPKPAYQTEVPTKKLTIGNKLSKLSNNTKRDVGNTIFRKKRK